MAIGGAIAVASNFKGKGKLVPHLVTAKHEVILSGIGNATELRRFGITPVVHLPGVGQNLQGGSRRSRQHLEPEIQLHSPQRLHIPLHH
ncbi:hypothetical protein C8R44DRAFT_916595 [Mycena epipterygia]|nr:hypothetical protein C8R44DRAFT_916595 [Mycena epipterygia]